jgi:hypothetical protein
MTNYEIVEQFKIENTGNSKVNMQRKIHINMRLTEIKITHMTICKVEIILICYINLHRYGSMIRTYK